MNLRECTVEDESRLLELQQKQGLDYPLPAMAEMLDSSAACDDGEIVLACLARPTVELYLLGDPQWRTPAWRFAALGQVHTDLQNRLRRHKITDAHIWLPPQMARTFGGRLKRSFGWSRAEWTSFMRAV